MLTAIYLLCAISTLTLGVSGLRRFISAPTLTLALILPTGFALPYDSVIIALGRLLGEGPLLVTLNWLRFLLHVLILPPLAVALALIVRGAGVRWAKHPAALPGAVFVGLITLVVGLFGELMGLQLAPHYRDDVLLYTHAHPVGPPPGAIMLLVASLIYGGALGLRARWPWIALAALYTVLVQAVPEVGLRGALVNSGEVLLLAALLLAADRFAPAVPVAQA
jgi:hypothetical protein